MPSSADHDSLRSVRNAFYLGLYSDVAKEVAAMDKGNKEAVAFADVYLARAQLALNPASFQPNANAPTAIQAVKQLATYMTTDDDHKEMVLDTVKEWLATPELQSDITLQLMAAQIHMLQGDLKSALQLVVNDADHLEKLSMCVLIYLRIDRVDLAARALKAMSDLDDDDTLTQLAQVWLAIAVGGDKINEAASLLQELLEKFGPSVPVLNSLAVCDIHHRNYTGAFQFTKQARDLSIKQGVKVSPETLLNSIVCLQHLRRGNDVISKIQAELKQTYPAHAWIRTQATMEEQFDRHAHNFRSKQ